jgi:hypothetical protein
MKRYFTEFLQSFGSKWVVIPGFVTGLAGVVAISKSLGFTWIPDVGWWAIVFFAFVPIAAFSIYELIKKTIDSDTNVEALNRRMAPAIRLSNFEQTGNATEQYIRFAIENIGGSQLRECLVEVRNINPPHLNALAEDLPRSIRTDTQILYSRSGRFNLSAGQTKYARVIGLNQTTGKTRFYIMTELDNYSLDIAQRYEIDIVAYAEQGLSTSVRVAFHAIPDKFLLFKDSVTPLG